MRRIFRTRNYQPDPEKDIREEIQNHLDLKTEELMATGLPEEEARAEALRRFGDRESLQTEAASYARTRERRRRLMSWPETLAQDARYAIRTLRRAPGMTALTILILALGIGANTAIFSVLKAVFLEPIPLPQAQELTFIWSRNIRTGGSGPASFPNYLDWKEQNSTFQAMGAFGGINLNLTGDGDPVRIRGARATASIFDVLAVPPAMGRTFHPEEDHSEIPVVILSHQLWTERYGADPTLVGRAIQIDGSAHTVIGIMPAEFIHPTPWGMGDPYLAWIPFGDNGYLQSRNSNSHQILARLAPGVGHGVAQANMNQIGIQLEEAFPDTNEEIRPWVVPLHQLLYGQSGFQVFMVLAAAGLVLLIACGNIAGFLLARAASRQTEMGIRASLGASRGRVIRQLLTESSILALAGGVGAILLAAWSLDTLKRLIPATIPRSGSIELDGGVLIFALLISLVTGVVFGLVPALSAARTDVTVALKGGAGKDRRFWKRMKSQNTFVVGQFALGMILANMGLLLIQSYAALRSTDQGFDEDHTLTMALSLGGDRYDDPEERIAFFSELIPSIRAIPGVSEAGITSKLPLRGGTNGPALSEEMLANDPNQRGLLTEVSTISGDYFGAMGIPLLAGRLLIPEDRDEAGPGVVINEAGARRFWGEEDPLGKRFGFGDNPSTWLTVVGVVGDVRQWGPESAPRPEMYQNYLSNPRARMFITVSGPGDPGELIQPVRAAVLQVDPNLPVSEIQTMGEILESQMAGREFYTFIIGLFSALALGLAAAGIYGVISYFVAQRTRDLGIRIALGAARNELIRLILGRALRIVFFGLLLGLGGVLASTVVIRSLLFGVPPLNPGTLMGGVALLTTVGVLAALLPCWRGTRLSPMTALRSE